METRQTRWHFMSRPVSIRTAAVVLCALVLLSLLPMVLVSLDNRPYYDDYSIGGRMTHAVWTATGSVFALLGGAFSVAATMYTDWEGNFVANYLNAIQLGAIRETLTFWITVVMLLATVFAAYRLSRALLSGRLGYGRAAAWLATAAFVYVSVQFVPHPNEAFFWQSGSVKYTLAHAAMMLTLAAGIRLTGLEKLRHPRWMAFGLCVLAFLCAGFNLMTGIAVTLGLLLCAAALWLKRARGRLAITLAAVAATVGYAINVLAPGNALRNNGFISPSPVNTVAEAMYATLEYIGRWTTLPVVSMALLCGVLAYRAAFNGSLRVPNPLWLLICSFGVLAAELAPPIYAGAYYDSGRIVNTVYLSYCVWALVNAVSVAAWLGARNAAAKDDAAVPTHAPDGTVADKAQDNHITPAKPRVQRGLTVALVLVCVVLTAVGTIGYGVRKIPGGASLAAMRTGQAKRYAIAFDERTLAMETSDQDTVRIDPMQDVPLVFMTEEGSWRSIAATYSLYYNKNIIGSSE